VLRCMLHTSMVHGEVDHTNVLGQGMLFKALLWGLFLIDTVAVCHVVCEMLCFLGTVFLLLCCQHQYNFLLGLICLQYDLLVSLLANGQ